MAVIEARWPDFFLIGAMKSATTSLYRYLSQHPALFLPQQKEPDYFRLIGLETHQISKRTLRTCMDNRDQYLALFDNARPEQITGDGSIHYLTSPIAPVEVARVAPHAKFLVILRQPAERAWSHFHFARELSAEPSEDFAEAVTATASTKGGDALDLVRAYMDIGYYDRHLNLWHSFFSPEQFCYVLYDDFAEHPHRELRRVFGFLGVDPNFRPDTSQRHTVGGTARNRWLQRLFSNQEIRLSAIRLLPPRLLSVVGRVLRRPPGGLPAPIRRRLTEDYREDILALQSRIGRDLSHWLDPAR